MLEKSNRTGPLADRQKVLLTATLRVFLFLGFSTTRETGDFQKISRELREVHENFRGRFFTNLIILTFFLIFSISGLIFSILLCCFHKLCLIFSFF